MILRLDNNAASGSATSKRRASVDQPIPTIDHAVLVRNTAVTHLVDGDQRSVILPVVSRADGSVELAAPPNSAGCKCP